MPGKMFRTRRHAVRLHPAMNEMLQQDMHEQATLAGSVQHLRTLVSP